MQRITVRRHYVQDRSTVWSELERVERHVTWMMDAESITFVTDQRQGVGTEFLCRTRVGPLALTDRMTITAWSPGETMAVRHHGLVTGEGSFFLESTPDGGTDVTWREVLRFPWFLGGRLGELVGKGIFRVIWRTNLERLGGILDTP